MKLTAIFGLIALSCFAGSARAQALGRLTININNPAWTINQNFPFASASDFKEVFGNGDDVLYVNGFVDMGNIPSVVNRAQTNVQGIRTTTPTPMSLSASASIGAPGAHMSFLVTGPNRPVQVLGALTATGVLPAQQSVNMSAQSSMTLNYGQFGPAGPKRQRIATATVTAPFCQGKICYVWNRLTLSQGASIPETFPSLPSFFYSQQGHATANCSLHQNEQAFENTDVLTDFTANLN